MAAPKLTKEEALKKLASLEKRLAKAKDADAKNREKIADLSDRVQGLEKELEEARAGAQKGLDEQKRALDASYGETVAGLEKTIADQAAAGKKADAALKKVSGLENQVMKLKWDLDAAREREKAQGGGTDNNAQVEELKKVVRQQEEEIKALKEAAASAPPPASTVEELASAPSDPPAEEVRELEEIRELKEDLPHEDEVADGGDAPPLISPPQDPGTA